MTNRIITLPTVATIAALVVSILVAFGVGPAMADNVRTVVVGAGPIVTAVWVHEHHATIRSGDAQASAIGIAKLQAPPAAQLVPGTVIGYPGPAPRGIPVVTTPGGRTFQFTSAGAWVEMSAADAAALAAQLSPH